MTAAFDGGWVTSDDGGLLLREVDRQLDLLKSLAACFCDHRGPEAIEFSVLELLRQRVMGLALGYEDLNDHERLRHDPLMALLAGRQDVTGQDRGKPLAGNCDRMLMPQQSTLNRLELTPVGADADSRYKKIVAHIEGLQDALVDVFVRLKAKQEVSHELVIDFDATDDPIHGDQLGKFFHGYYKSYCFLPLYAFCGDWPLAVILRPSNIDASAGTVDQLARIVPKLRAAWPDVHIVIRGDSGFCRESIMPWCEENGVDDLFGLAKNKRLIKAIGKQLHAAKQQFEQTGEAARVFKNFTYSTKKSWSKERRVVAKAEHLKKGANPRFVVTSLPAERVAAAPL